MTTLGQIVIFEKDPTDIPWKEIAKTLRVKEKVFTCLKSAIQYVNQNEPSVFLISNADSKKLPWKHINPLIQSHLNASSKKMIISSNNIIDPIFPLIAPTSGKIVDALENLVHEKYILENIKKHKGLPVVDGKIMLGESPAMITLFQMILRRSAGDENCLIYGESGVGKTVTTEALHYYHADRHKHPLEIVNIGEVNESVFEAEFFGARKGSYTGCTQDRRGLFDRTEGTLFIDEIGNLPMGSQNKLLRALGDKKYKPVGSQETKDIKARLVFATNRDLNKMVEEKQFMGDLLFRIEKLSIHIPSLRERKTDIPLLVNDYVTSLNWRYGKSKRVTEETSKYLALYSWPGNIRELRSKIEMAFIESNGSDITIDNFRDIQIDAKLLLDADRYKAQTHVHFLSLHTSGKPQDKHLASLSLRLKEKMIERNTERSEIMQNVGISKTTLSRFLKENPKNIKEIKGISKEFTSRLEYWIETGKFLPINSEHVDFCVSDVKIKKIMDERQLGLRDLAESLNVSKQAVSKWLKRITIDERGVFTFIGIPKDKAELIVFFLKQGKISTKPVEAK